MPRRDTHDGRIVWDDYEPDTTSIPKSPTRVFSQQQELKYSGTSARFCDMLLRALHDNRIDGELCKEMAQAAAAHLHAHKGRTIEEAVAALAAQYPVLPKLLAFDRYLISNEIAAAVEANDVTLDEARVLFALN